jgi:hypothetical protein
MVAVDEKSRNEGHLRHFIDCLAGFMREEFTGRAYKSAWILLGMSRESKPHEAFYKLGFTRKVPEHLKRLTQKYCDMAALDITLENAPVEKCGTPARKP